LYLEDLGKAYETCKLTITRSERQDTEILNIAPGKYVISSNQGLKALQICHDKQPLSVKIPKLAVLQLPCACTISSDNFTLTGSIAACENKEINEVTVDLPVNILAAMHLAQEVNPDILLMNYTEIINTKSLKIPDISADTGDKEFSADLKQVADNLRQQDSYVMPAQRTYNLVNKYLSGGSVDIIFYLTIANSILIGFLTFVVFRFWCKGGTVKTAVATTLLPVAKALPIPKIGENELVWQINLNKPFVYVILCLLIFYAIVKTMRGVHKCYSNETHLFLINPMRYFRNRKIEEKVQILLELYDESNDFVVLKLGTTNCPPDNVILSKGKIEFVAFETRYCRKTVLHLKWGGIKLKSPTQKYELPTSVKIPFFLTKRCKKIIRGHVNIGVLLGREGEGYYNRLSVERPTK
jgi:hypothetical protein